MFEIIAILLFVVVVLLIAYVLYLKREIDVRAEKRFMELEAELRKRVADTQRAVVKGRIAEQIVPFLEQFNYNPSDARFIGSPIDYVIFEGYTECKDNNEERPITVVLADIKTGKRGSLTREQRRIKQAIEEKRVKWETITLQC